MSDVRDKSALLPDHTDLLLNDTSSSSSSCGMSDASGIVTSPDVMRITDRLMSVDQEGNRQPLLQISLLPEGFSMRLLPVSSGAAAVKANGSSNCNNHVNNNNGSEAHEVFLPYDEGCDIIRDMEAGCTPPVFLDYLMAKYPSRLAADDYGQDVDVLLKDLRQGSPDHPVNHVHNHLNESAGSSNNITRHVRLKSSNLTIAKIVHHKIMSQNHQHRLNRANSSATSSSSPHRNQNLNNNNQQNQQQNHDNQLKEKADSNSGGDTILNVQMNGHVTEESSDTPAIKSEPMTPPVTPKAKSRSKSKSSSCMTKDRESGDPNQGSWDQESEEMDQIESQIVHNSSPHALCLDPSPVVHLIHNRLSCAGRHRHEILTAASNSSSSRKLILLEKRKRMQLLKSLRGSSESKEEDERLFLASNPHLKLSTFLHRRQDRKPAVLVNRLARKLSTGSSGSSTNVSETKLDMEKVSEEINRLSVKLRNLCAHLSRVNETSLTKIEEYVMEFDSSSSASQAPIPSVTCVSIFHRQIDDVFFGQLYVDRPGVPSSSSRSCLYKLGSRDAAKKYLEQFKEILTENGRKAVRITRTGSTGIVTSSSTGGQMVQNPAHVVANTATNASSPSCVTNPPHALQTIVNSLSQSFNASASNSNIITHAGNFQTGMVLSSKLMQQPQQQHRHVQHQIQVQGQPQQQIATKVILPPVVQAGVDQLIQQQQHQQQFRIQPQAASGPKIQIQAATQHPQNNPGMICTMIPQNTAASFNQQQLRSIPGTNSWIVLPPVAAPVSGGQAQVTAQTVTASPAGQAAAGQQAHQLQQQQTSGYRPVHVILWPQQQPPAAPAQHHVVSSNNNNNLLTTSSSTTTTAVMQHLNSGQSSQ